MRPLELVIKGFRSFAERTEIDWRGRRLVGVVGPIGSGKTSILDAVAFALYGRTPVFGSESKTLIRHGAESARVELAFEADGAAWRVIRVIRHSGSGRHVLYRDTGETLTNPVCEKERDVTAKIEELLGLDFPTFCRSVLLAQNRFAEFLNASPGDRDRVLKGVFGFDRLDDMQALARDRRAGADLELRELQGRLATVEDDRRRLEEARRALELSGRQVKRLEEAAEKVRCLGQRQGEARRRIEEAGRRARELDDIAAQMPSTDEVDATLGAADAAVAELARFEDEQRRGHDAVAEAERARAAVLDEVGSAEDHARVESRLDVLRRAETQHQRQQERRRQLERRREDKRAELAEAAKTVAAAARDEEEAREQAEKATVELELAAEARNKLMHEIGDRNALARAREELQRLRLARADRDREREAHRRLEERLATAEDDLARAAAERDRAVRTEEDAQIEGRRATETVVQAEEAMHQAEHAEMALTLSKTLKPGKPCPVCDQPVRAVQVRLPSENLEDTRAELETARRAERSTAARLLELSKKAATWRQTVENVERERSNLGGERDEIAGELARHEATCVEIEADLSAILGSGDPEVRLVDAEQKMAALDARLARSQDDERQAVAKQREAAHNHELARQQESALRETLEELAAQLEDAAAENREAETAWSEARADVEKLLGEGDPEELLLRARERLAAADARLEEARGQERRAVDRRDEARRFLDEKRRDQEGLVSRLAGLAGQLGHVHDGAAALTPRQLSREVRERFDEARRAAATAEAERREEETAAREERRRILLELKLDANADFETALAAGRAAAARDGAAVTEFEERLERSKELTEKHDAMKARHDLYARLADDLTASKFLRYLLEQERAGLADLGSARFELLTEGRYRFTTDGSFQVIDQYNADAERKPDTLSGGETFLASLALALALAEKVTAGGGRLDAFFLDEGFGSLDPEHLTLAMEGIERLVTDSSNRLVTVVSHVPEMRDRIEDLIELDRDPLTGKTIVRGGAR